MSTSEIEAQVLIVGAGPAGLTAALALARAGVEVLLVERRPQLSGLPRATGLSLRSMELMRSFGLEGEIEAGAIDAEWKLWRGETLLDQRGQAMDVGAPTREQAAVLSPSVPLCVPQDHIEPVLLSALERHGNARVELGVELVELDQAGGEVRAVARSAERGGRWAIRAQYVLGADGARSRVRSEVGIEMRGPDRLLEATSALFHAPLWSLLGERRYIVYGITLAAATGAFVPASRGDRWIYGSQSEPGDDSGSNFTADRLTRLIRLASGASQLDIRIEETRSFTFAAQMADRYREGNVFIAGDAAHRVTPRGGTGMNTAIHSGYDLGWKLAWVLNGWAEQGLLDSYEDERRPAAMHNVERSADPEGSPRETSEEMHADLGGRMPHVWVGSGGARSSTLDLLGLGLTLFTGPDAERLGAAAAELDAPLPIEVRRLDSLPARALGLGGDGALLARPDGSPLGSWARETEAAAGLRLAVESLAGGRADELGVAA